MKEARKSSRRRAQSNYDSSKTSIRNNNAATPKYENITRNYIKYAKQLIWRFICFPILKFIRCLDRHSGALSALATLAIAFLTYFLVSYTHEQGEITNRQLSLMEADQRPWVRPVVISTSPLIITDKELSFQITIQYLNIGKLPAFRVYAHADIFPGGQATIQKHDDICKMTEVFGRKSDLTIFPNEPNGQTLTIGTQSSNPKSFYESTGEAPSSPINIVIPVFLGCIVYQDTAKKIHHTWFSYRIIRADGDKGATFISPGVQTIPPEKVVIRLGPYGRNTVD